MVNKIIETNSTLSNTPGIGAVINPGNSNNSDDVGSGDIGFNILTYEEWLKRQKRKKK